MKYLPLIRDTVDGGDSLPSLAMFCCVQGVLMYNHLNDFH